MVSAARTLPELLEEAAAGDPRPIGLVGRAPLPLAELVARATRTARALVWRGLQPGRPALLVIHDLSDFLVAFWGALYAGAVPAPVAGPRDVGETERARLTRIAKVLGDPLVVVDRALAPWMPEAVDVGALFSAADAAAPLRAARSGPALVQFSSGSTRDPTGVTLTHDNLLANVAQLAQALPLTPQDHVLSWMPHFHDMGLIGAHLVPLALGCAQTRMEPGAAMADPLDWLDAAALLGATCLPSTPLALARAVRAWERSAGRPRPDLSRVRLVMSGAEPIDPEVLRAFSRAFALSDDIHLPLYGLAEATVGVCAPRRPGVFTREVEGRARVVVGAPLPGMRLRVVDDEGCLLPEGQVGDVEVDGPNVTRGYWGASDATSALFHEGWLRTGDRGVLHQGELTVVGRTKDVLFANGRTLHAHDLELLVEEVEGVRPASAVVFADPRRTDEAVVALLLLEPDADAPRVLRDVRRALRAETGLDVSALLMSRVPRTTSGKKRRGFLREQLARGVLSAEANVATEDAVAALWSSVLGRALLPAERATPFRNLGGTSVQAVQIVARVAERFRVAPSPRLLLEGGSVQAMAALLLQEDLDEGPGPATLPTAPTKTATTAAMTTATGAAGGDARSGGGAHVADRVAIVGIALRLPGARGPQALWDLAESGQVLLEPAPPERRNQRGGRGAADAPPIGSWLSLDDLELFPAERFRIAEADLAVMDPPQRVLLELFDQLLQQAPLGTRRVGVFVGAGQVANLEGLMGAADQGAAPLPPGALPGNLLNILAARTAQALDLNGPALTVDTACSASLVAVHLALQAMRSGDCEAALVAGTHLNLSSRIFELFHRAGALSPSGRCRPFEPDADGTVPGEGLVALALAPEALVEARGLPVLGFIRGSAVNNDGATLGIMAPSPTGQEEVLRRALHVAGVAAGDIRRVEAHGSATRVGDEVERAVLARVYGHGPHVDSVKRNLGHLMGAAGAAGLARLLGALRPGELGAVSSFGFGGTNAHLIVEGARQRVGPAQLAERLPAGQRFPLLRAGADTLAASALPNALGTFIVAPGAPGRLLAATPGADATRRGGRFVVTGALGGLGRALCRRLAERGARLLLIGRRPAAEVEPELRALEELGAALRYQAIDLAEAGAGARVAAAARDFLDRVDGIFHLAGGLSASSLVAKRAGVAELRTLDSGFTVYASSVAACVPGLALGLEEYAAANAALDEAARHAWSAGDACVRSVALGPIEEVGLAAGAGAREHFSRLGLGLLRADEAAEALCRAPSLDAPHLAFLRREVARAAALPAPPPASPPGPPPTRGQLFDEALRLVAQALHKRPEELDRDLPFAALGLDSIVAIDIVKQLELLAGRELSTTLLFEHDTLARLERFLEGLAPPAAARAQPSAHDAGAASLELLPAQRTWVVQRRFFPDMPGNVFLAATVLPEGAAPLVPDEIERALDVLVPRHPALAARVARVDGRWCQVPGPRPLVTALDALDAAAEDRVTTEPFELEAGPLVRVLSDGRRLAINAHHAVLDAWSVRILMEELLRVVAAHRQGAIAPLPSLHSSLPELFSALRRTGTPEDLSALAQRVAGAPPLPLPSRADPDAPVAGGAALHRRILDEHTTAAVLDTARAAGAGVPATVLAAFLHALFDATGQHDLLVRLAHGGRDVRVPDADRHLGAFADSLPLRARIELDDTLGTLARRVHEEIGFLLARSTVSAAQLGGSHDAEQGPVGVSPVAFSFPPAGEAQAPPGFVLRDITGRAAAGATRVTLVAFLAEGRLHLCFNYARSHVDATFAVELGARVERLLREGVEPLPATLHGGILQRAALHPERHAVGELSYGALARRTAALASRLVVEHGAGPGTRVAVLAAPSADAVVALVAVLRTGAAYVPLDPAWPDARVAQVLASARCAALLAPPGLARRARGLMPQGLLIIDDEEAETGPCVEIDGVTQSAYVMFTSGTSGAPKGVEVSHRSCLAFQRWVLRAFRVGPEDRFAQTSSLAFGGSVRQVFSPLLTGASIHPVTGETLRDPEALVRFLEDERITLWNSVPSLFTHLLDAAERSARPSPFAAMRAILLGGEPVPASVVRRWRGLAGRLCGDARACRWFNLYGSVETLVNATWFEAVRDPAADDIHTPIGWPRAFTEVALVGAEVDGFGELAVSGAIASGYFDDPALTESSFRPLEGRRAYHTGDLARRLPDGSLVHLGRKDSQVQVRGNRVETLEIELTLAAHAEVRAAAVVFVDGWLRASVELQPGASASEAPARLRAFLEARLPSFMVPNRIEVVSALPRNPAGKADKLALRAAAATEGRAGTGIDARGRRSLRSALAEAWRSVLGLAEDPADDDDFYGLGGDSLRALEVLDRLRETLGARAAGLRPLALHRHRRFGALLEALLASVPDAPVADRPATAAPRTAAQGAHLPRAPALQEAPASAVQRGFLWAQEKAGRAPTFCASLPLVGALDLDALVVALRALVERHGALQLAFAREAAAGRGAPWRQLRRPTAVSLPMEDLRGLDEGEQRARCRAAFEELAALDFVPGEAPLWRARLLRCGAPGEERHELVLAAHHAIVDAWSAFVIAAELCVLHDDLQAGRPPSLPPLARSFLDVAAEERTLPTDEERRHWAGLLSGLVQEAAPLEVERSRTLELPEEVRVALWDRARALAVSPFSLFFGLVTRALAELEDVDDLAVSVAADGRGTAAGDDSRVVGPFARGVPVRLRGARRLEPIEVDALLGAALAHADAPPAAIAAALGGDALDRLSRYFVSWLDPSGVPLSSEGKGLRPRWDQARVRFAASSTRTSLMVGALVGERGLTLHLHGGALVDRAAPLLQERLARLARADSVLLIYPPTPLPLAEPVRCERVTARLGISDLVLLPVDAAALPHTRDLEARVAAALTCSDAPVAALAGVLPALLGLGLRGPVLDKLLTTGHAATVVAMAWTVGAALRALGATFADCRVAVVGYGSIGKASLALCRALFGEPALVRVVDPRVPGAASSVSGCDLILGATSGGRALDVDALAPGTVVVDDSFPRAFDDVAAWGRMRGARDVLLVGGGMLDAGPLVRRSPFAEAARAWAELPVRWLPGCHAEAMLLARRPALGPTRGPVLVERALAVAAALEAEGLRAAPLHLGRDTIDEDILAGVRRARGRVSG